MWRDFLPSAILYLRCLFSSIPSSFILHPSSIPSFIICVAIARPALIQPFDLLHLIDPLRASSLSVWRRRRILRLGRLSHFRRLVAGCQPWIWTAYRKKTSTIVAPELLVYRIMYRIQDGSVISCQTTDWCPMPIISLYTNTSVSSHSSILF